MGGYEHQGGVGRADLIRLNLWIKVQYISYGKEYIGGKTTSIESNKIFSTEHM
jgi:hypothetical protein